MERRACRTLFCFNGATPATSWLQVVALDEDGFVLTDADLMTQDLPTRMRRLGSAAPSIRDEPSQLTRRRRRTIGVDETRRRRRVGEGSGAIPAVHRAIAGWS